MMGMQTDDILIVGSKEFARREDKELEKAKLQAKSKQKLTVDEPLVFNKGILTKESDRIVLRQKK